MYSFEWMPRTGGYRLTPEAGKFVAAEIRPVYVEELKLIGFDKHFDFATGEELPLMWAKHNRYFYKGEEVARLEKTQYGKPINPIFLCDKYKLIPVQIDAMLRDKANHETMAALVANTLKRIKEMYDKSLSSCDVAYIGFSGGKDSVLLLDLCHRVLPLSVPVIFSDTDMELPDTYVMWDEIQKLYPGRQFIRVRAAKSALENWETFGPPSRTIRWCCSIHKSTPAILKLREMLGKPRVKAMAFLGVRSEESLRRSEYDDIGDAVKNASQVNAYPILDWGAHELWLYTFANNLPINHAYRKGLPRVGCILCPESSEKHVCFANMIYPKAVLPYNKAVLSSIDKKFTSKNDEIDYLATVAWKARKSGEVLKETLPNLVEHLKGNTIVWNIPKFQVLDVYEWLKTIGQATRDKNQIHITYLNPQSSERHAIEVMFTQNDEYTQMICVFDSPTEVRTYSKFLRNVVRKAGACVGCSACEVECPTGALSFSTERKIQINSTLCVNCLNCHSIDYGCWRFKSMYESEVMRSALSSINKYTKFGLRTDWVSVYTEEKANFSQTTRLGKKMIPAARAWFRQARLMNEKSCEPRKLLSLAEMLGITSQVFWDSVWLGLVNHAPLIKWVVTTLKVDVSYTSDDLFSLLGSDLKDITKTGGVIALKDMLTKCPIGSGDDPIVKLELKGKARHVVSLARVSHEVSPLVLLYGLYIMAEKTDRSAFTVTQMMSADFESAAVSPLVAFALPVADFQRQLSGLATKYPEFLRCSFQMGLDEVYVYPEKKSADDVLDLMLNENL